MTTPTLAARMPQPAYAVPGAMDALIALGQAVSAAGVPESTRELAHLRASQINSCGVCLVQHTRAASQAGVEQDKISAIAGWRDAPYFDDAERAALALAEAITRLADHSAGVPDDVWAQAAEHFDQTQIAALILSIASVNLWNRLNVTTRQVAGISW